MDWIRILFNRCAALFRTRELDDDLDAELRAHIEFAVEENRERGMSESKARAEALRSFGGIAQTRENYRMQRGLPFLEVLIADLRIIIRQLLKSPGFALTAILMVALGVGANAAIFSLFHAVLLQSLPVTKPEQIYRLGANDNCCVWNGSMGDWSIYSYSLYTYLRDHSPEFEEMAAFSTTNSPLSVRQMGRSDPPRALNGEFVSGNYFSMFGLHAAEGRLFNSGDDHAGAAPVAVMSDHAWREYYGADPSIVGSTIMVNGLPFSLAGIAPRGFFGDRLTNSPPELWVPVNQEPLLHPLDSLLHLSNTHWLYAMGRAGDGFQPASAQVHLTTEIRQWLQGESDLSTADRANIPRERVRLSPGGAGISGLRDYYQKALYLLSAIAALVLLIACANLANLLLVREAARRHQTMIQMALGAPRNRVLRTVLTESTSLAFLGGIAGLGFAYSGTRAILALAFGDTKNLPLTSSPSLPVIGFAFAISLMTGILFGIIPSWLSSRSDPSDALRGTHRAVRGGTSVSQKSLIVFQATLSLILLTLGGLLTHSLNSLESQPLGFESNNRIIVQFDPQAAGYKPEQLSTVYQDIESRMNQVPGVESVGISSYTPQDSCCWNSGIDFQDEQANSSSSKMTSWLRVSADYFETMGIHLSRGRSIGPQDTSTSPRVAVVDEAFARKFFSGRNPIGQHFGMGGIAGHAGDYEIVGVVEDTQYVSVTSSQNPMFYLPMTQSVHFQVPSYNRTDINSLYAGRIELLVRTTHEDIMPQVRSALAGINPNLTVLRMTTLKDQVALTLNQPRLIAELTTWFSVLALILASVGLYGVTEYSVVRRTEEIGIRMALGARRAWVLSMVLGSALRQTALGLALGVPLSLLGGRLIASQLYRTSPYSLVILVGAGLVLLLSALVAGIIPARRAASIDPMRALRAE
jgi:macrolide transport system ATP-binding/permease protein